LAGISRGALLPLDTEKADIFSGCTADFEIHRLAGNFVIAEDDEDCFERDLPPMYPTFFFFITLTPRVE